ncbi:UvrD-helicase domain-containing protein [Brachybacterium sp. Z12]|uniref:UvrD-helicase domain-containing protein n=1 Tax=Brachybacterium sp. Z12 TaxID=2759167 RepID=UPI00223A6D23|nr:UvrD-helicase domain-containing protein [Brachybacterium sp. Z12]
MTTPQPADRHLHSAAHLAALLEQPPPTTEQTRVIEAPLAPMLVVAGAGSGKTETMASRVVWLIANGIVEPRQVLGLTFTRKAAHELAERISARLASSPERCAPRGSRCPPGSSAAVMTWWVSDPSSTPTTASPSTWCASTRSPSASIPS